MSGSKELPEVQVILWLGDQTDSSISASFIIDLDYRRGYYHSRLHGDNRTSRGRWPDYGKLPKSR